MGAVVRPAPNAGRRGAFRPAHGGPLLGPARRARHRARAPCQRRLPRGGAERAADVHLGLARDARSGVTVIFAPEGDHTLLTLTHERLFDDAARDDHRQGWMEALD